MKKIIILLLVFICAPVFALAQDYKKSTKKEALSPGTKKVRVDGTTVLLQEDRKIRTEGSVTTTESFRQYVGRRFTETDARISKIETSLEGLRKELGRLRQALLKMQNELKEHLARIEAKEEESEKEVE